MTSSHARSARGGANDGPRFIVVGIVDRIRDGDGRFRGGRDRRLRRRGVKGRSPQCRRRSAVRRSCRHRQAGNGLIVQPADGAGIGSWRTVLGNARRKMIPEQAATVRARRHRSPPRRLAPEHLAPRHGTAHTLRRARARPSGSVDRASIRSTNSAAAQMLHHLARSTASSSSPARGKSSPSPRRPSCPRIAAI